MSFQTYLTASDLIRQVLGSMGLAVPNNLVGGTDRMALQMLELLNELGQETVELFHWQVLDREHTITTTIGNPTYPLPAGWSSYKADSSWNRTTMMPVLGPLDDHEWQMLKARNLAGTTFTVLFRIEGGNLIFHEPPTSVQTIVLPYTSTAWIKKSDSSYADRAEANDDLVQFSIPLMKAGLKKKWYEAKGFDVTRWERNWLRCLSTAKSKDVPGRTLSLTRGGDYPYLGLINVPDTRFGM